MTAGVHSAVDPVAHVRGADDPGSAEFRVRYSLRLPCAVRSRERRRFARGGSPAAHWGLFYTIAQKAVLRFIRDSSLTNSANIVLGAPGVGFLLMPIEPKA